MFLTIQTSYLVFNKADNLFIPHHCDMNILPKYNGNMV